MKLRGRQRYSVSDRLVVDLTSCIGYGCSMSLWQIAENLSRRRLTEETFVHFDIESLSRDNPSSAFTTNHLVGRCIESLVELESCMPRTS
jgi:hypothetical protein